MKTNTIRTLVALGLLLVIGSLSSAFAASYSFSFNSVAAGATNGTIQSYMNTVLGGGGRSVALTGAKEANGYTGDGHVTGPCVGSTCTSYTLGKDDAGTDRFIINLQQTANEKITMQFTGLKIYSITFDLEIFPDASCPSPSNCPTKPDFKFYAGNGGTTSLINTWVGSFPASPGYTHSPVSGASATETSAQLIVKQYTYSNTSGFDTVWFADWPATIGVDNVTINTTVPEPASIFLVSSGVLAIIRRKKIMA